MFIRFNVRIVRQKGSEALPSKGPLKTENLSGTFKVLFNLPLLLMIFLSFVLCSFFSSPAAPVQRLIRGQIDSNKRKTVPSEGPFLPNGCPLCSHLHHEPNSKDLGGVISHLKGPVSAAHARPASTCERMDAHLSK